MHPLVHLLCVVQLLPKLFVLLFLNPQIVLQSRDLRWEVSFTGHRLQGFTLLRLNALHRFYFLLILLI
jgi:hypothetical protein